MKEKQSSKTDATRLSSVASIDSDVEFNTILFEKKLATLKDSQESINNCCHWCLDNRQHHKKIVASWLTVLKRVKVDHRLTLFYLANDVIQYSKRRNYDFVESWGTTLQKATTMVRDNKVKHKITRIFKIWESRGIYGEEFISDLCGLISVSPRKSSDEPGEFQVPYLIQKIKSCTYLESDTDAKLKELKEHNPKLQIDSESLILSLKDRAHVDDVENELQEYNKFIDNYVGALRLEIKSRMQLIDQLMSGEDHLETERRDVKLVATAYKTFATRVKALKKKLDELMPTLSSPIPSPDVDAPSPSPDSDDEFATAEAQEGKNTSVGTNSMSSFEVSSVHFGVGYYNPVPPPSEEAANAASSNNYSSFIGADIPFSIQSLKADLDTGGRLGLLSDTPSQKRKIDLDGTTSAVPSSLPLPNLSTSAISSADMNRTMSAMLPSLPCPPLPLSTTASSNCGAEYYQNNAAVSHLPLMPPPMPPFSKQGDSYASAYGDVNYGTSYDPTSTYNPSQMPYNPTSTDMSYQPQQPTTYDSTSDYNRSNDNNGDQAYNPSQPNFRTNNSSFRTTESPFSTPLANLVNPYPPPPPPVLETPDEYNPEEELETWEPEPSWEQPPVELDTPESPPMYEKEGYGDPVEYHDGNDGNVFGTATDVDHRVLPGGLPLKNSGSEKRLDCKDVDHRNLISLTNSPSTQWSPRVDQDYRVPPPNTAMTASSMDRDYRLPFPIDNITLPPPPPPPPITDSHEKKGHRHRVDDTIDMDLSDDDHLQHQRKPATTNENLRVITPVDLELPPPPFMDDNMFLDHEGEPEDLDFDNNMSFAEEDAEMQEPAMLPPPFPVVPGMLGTPTMLIVPPPMMHSSTLWPNNNVEQQVLFRGRGRGGGFGRGTWCGPGRGGDRGAGGFRGRPPRGGRGGWGGNQAQRGFVPRGGRGRGNFRAGFRGGGF